MAPSILITGATGTIGQLLIQELASRGVPARALVRQAECAEAVLDAPLLEVVEGDLGTPASIDSALAGISRVFLLSPVAPNQITLQGNVIEAVQRTQRSIHLVNVSAVGAVPPDVPLRLARWHNVTEAQLQSTGLPATILRPHFLMQNLLRAAPSIRHHNMLCGSFHHARLPLVDGRDVATVAATVLTTEKHAGRDYTLTGPQALSYTEVADTFSTVLGRRIRYVDMPTEAYREYLVAGGLEAWMADDLTTLARSFHNGHSWPVTSVVPEITGQPARTVEQFVRDYADAFAPTEGPAYTPEHLTLPCDTTFWSPLDSVSDPSHAESSGTPRGAGTP